MQAMLDCNGASTLPPELRGGERLSYRLRTATAPARQQAEALIGLPRAEWAGVDKCLRRFRSLSRPLEARLAGFSQWAGLEIELAGWDEVRPDAASGTIAPETARDRAVWLDAPRQALPHLPTFAHALGGLYALTIFRSHDPRLDDGVDLYGLEWPASSLLAIEGAERTFTAIGRWMDAKHWRLSA